MDEPHDTSDDRLEPLLRRWGAEEAARSAKAPAAPVMPGRTAPRALGVLLRWAPLAAAAVLLVISGKLYLDARSAASGAGGPNIEDVPVAIVPPTTMPDARELRRLEGENADLRKRLAELTGGGPGLREVREKLTKLEAELADERRLRAADVRELTATAEARDREKRELADKLQAADGRIAALEEEKKVLQPAADELPKARRKLADVQKRLLAAVDEIERNRKQHSEAIAEAAEMRRRSQLLRLRHAEIVAAFQRTYLGSVAPGQQGLRARKVAARARRMIDRCTALTAEAPDASARQLLGKLEVVLTRLELLDPERLGAREAFAKLVARGDLARQIDAALEAGDGSQDLRSWLFEAKLILMGAGNAG